jgi:pantothenate kinase-related protein Tda10
MRSFLIGIDGLAGSGKTTLAVRLRRECASAGLTVCTLSLDDGYWSGKAYANGRSR